MHSDYPQWHVVVQCIYVHITNEFTCILISVISSYTLVMMAVIDGQSEPEHPTATCCHSSNGVLGVCQFPLT